MSDKNFADGLRVTRRDNAPDFVVCQLGFKASDFAHWMRANMTDEGWVNVDVKRSKSGNLYAELNDWKPKQEKPQHPDDDIPF